MGLMLAVLAALGILFIRKDISEVRNLVEHQVEPLADIARLQSNATDIRKREAELPRIADYFAATAMVDELRGEIALFETKLEAFLSYSALVDKEEGKRLKTSWELYRNDLSRSMNAAGEGRLDEALNISTFASSPRFTTFARHLYELSDEVERNARAHYLMAAEQVGSRQQAFILLSVIGTLIGVCFAVVFSRSLSSRLKILGNEAEELASGRMDRDVALPGGDELAALAESFNRMRLRLREREQTVLEVQASLERRVEERTRELIESNKRLMTEIGQREQMGTALRQSERSLKNAQRIAGLGSWEWDIGTEVLLVSEALQQMLGIDAPDLCLSPLELLRKLVHPDDFEQIVAVAGQARASGQIPPFECRVVMADGQQRIIWNEGELTLSPDGKPVRVIGAALDITQRKATERQLLQVQRLEAVGQLAAGIAHDFNNLLSVILGNNALARLRADRQEPGELFFDEIDKATEKARTLSTKLLTFAKGGAPTVEHADIVNLLHEAAALALAGTNIDFVFEGDEAVMPVEVDPLQMSQVLKNLLINAREAMPDGGTVHLGTRNLELTPASPGLLPPGAYVEVSVRDSGHGIAPGDQEKIFDLYYSTKERGDEKGMGMGLSICHSIVTRHRGDIQFSSVPGEGTVFRVRLPAAASAEPAGDQQSDLIYGTGRLLVMDDEPMLLRMLAGMLTRLGYEVTAVANGTEALENYREAMSVGAPYHAAILDLTVRGGMGGIDTLKELHRLDPNLPGIVSSGYADEGSGGEYAEHGFRAVIPKPYSIEQMSRIVHEVIAKT